MREPVLDLPRGRSGDFPKTTAYEILENVNILPPVNHSRCL